ncbi:PQQ-dependent sugar dehydrogenase [Nocardia sp. NPDC050697]|uniref:PQQ-dependent sugar dehydrogenase n=1 Tax=Nocardia sp. NPDC050697 TaxID=3155158 RepID=UPI0033E6E5B3
MTVVAVGRVALGLVLASTVLAGCARFDDSASSPFTPEPTFGGAQIGPSEPQAPSSTQRPTGPCIDPDPAVVATCLDPTAGLVAVGDGALVAERRTGRILKVVPEQPAVEIARIDVDGSGDGGLNDLALSPTYREDGLIYAYITTGSDNRVVRIAAGGPPKEILTGIPKGATGNHGALEFVTPEKLLVLTGDAGNPGAAQAPGTLAGKLLSITDPRSGGGVRPETVLAGIGTAGDVCRDAVDGVWITDRTATEDRLQRVGPDNVAITAWTWPDRPGVGGCATTADGVAVALSEARALALVAADPASRAVTTAPTIFVQDKYGRLNGATPGPDGAVWVGTVNKDGGQPGPNDDRVVRIPPPAGGGGGPD